MILSLQSLHNSTIIIKTTWHYYFVDPVSIYGDRRERSLSEVRLYAAIRRTCVMFENMHIIECLTIIISQREARGKCIGGPLRDLQTAWTTYAF